MSFDHHKQQRIQSLLDKKARIDARLEAEISFMDPRLSIRYSSRNASVPSGQYGQTSVNQAGRREIPRAYSTSMGRQHSSDPMYRESTELSRNFSQPMSSSMARRGSLATSSSTKMSHQLSSSHPRASSLHAINTQVPASAIKPWDSVQDGPFNTYTLSHQPYSAAYLPSSDPAADMLSDIGEHPLDYLSRTSPGALPTGRPNRNGLYHRSSVSSRHSFQSPMTPCSATLTTATTLPSEMSRDNSFCNEALESFQMMHVHSNTSAYSEFDASDGAYLSHRNALPSPSDRKRLSSNEGKVLLTGAGSGIGQELSFSLSQVATAPVPYESSIPSTEMMERGQSSDSSSSNSSSKYRAKMQLQKQNQLAATRKLAPKAGSDSVSMSRNSSQLAMMRIQSKDGMDDKYVAAITKAPYQRPKHDRVFCKQCNEVPQGFRGAHELRRHMDRQHPKVAVKRFACVEPADGINPNYKPVNPMSRCKACNQLNKTYGAYYNAAAHLRRAHFVPKQRGRGKANKVDDKSEKRGGKGGGEWPPMSELKRWMKEVWVNVDSQQAQQDIDDEADEQMGSGCEDDYSEGMEKHTIIPITTITPALPDVFDASLMYTDTSMYDAYTILPSTFVDQARHITQNDLQSLFQNIQNMESVQFELPLHFDSNQSSYESQCTLMDDGMPFIDNSQAHNYEDPSQGSDFLSPYSY